jgi:hypothetical protein
MFRSRSVFLATVMAALILVGCTVSSKYRTRSFMTEEESRAFDEKYYPPPPGQSELEMERLFLEGFEGPAIRVNGLDIDAADIRQLYEYLLPQGGGVPLEIKEVACLEWIRVYAVMSQWPDTIEPAKQRLMDIKAQVESGVDFGSLIIENSQEPDVDRTGGDLGEVGMGQLDAVLEMHAFSDPIGQVVGPIPTVYGWHLLEVLERTEGDGEGPKVHARHLLLFHGLDPGDSDSIKENAVMWTNTARVENVADEVKEIVPQGGWITLY